MARIHSRWLKQGLAQLALPLALATGRSLRVRSNNHNQPTDPWDPALNQRYIYAFWHESLLGMLAVRSCAPVAALVSPSEDGGILSQLCQRVGVQPIRGSSTRGGSNAAEEVLAEAADSHLLISPDGPMGPRREVKRGFSYLASWSGKAVVPLGIGFSRAVRLKTWDQMAIPLPFSTVTLVSGPLLEVPPQINKKQSEHFQRELQRRMQAAQTQAAAWATETQLPAATLPAPVLDCVGRAF